MIPKLKKGNPTAVDYPIPGAERPQKEKNGEKVEMDPQDTEGQSSHVCEL